MTKTIKGDLIMDKDMFFDEDIIVKGNIFGKPGSRYDLKVRGNIDAWDIDAWDIDAGDIHAGNIDAGDIDAWNIDAWNIDAWNIDAGDIDAWDIDAGDIDAGFIVCDQLKQIKGSKLMARNVITNRSTYEQKDMTKAME